MRQISLLAGWILLLFLRTCVCFSAEAADKPAKPSSASQQKSQQKSPALKTGKQQAAKLDNRWAQDLLAGPLGDLEIVFATRIFVNPEHWYANIGYFATDENKKVYGTGGRLCKLNLKTGKVTRLIDDARGAVRDPCVHYDGQTILFSYRKGGTDAYHLYEIQADGTGLRQLTDGKYDDFEPCYLPDGGIVFVSTRAQRWVNCWVTQVAVIYRCDGDGQNIRQLSANIEQDNTPWVLPDGRILYTRWEYIDRSQLHYHHLWTMNPDGSGQMVYFGNFHPGGVFIDAKPIPGTDRVVLIRSPNHGRAEHAGAVVTVTPERGPDYVPSMRNVSKSPDFRDPWALRENLFLAAWDDQMVLMNRSGETYVLYKLPPEFRPAWLHEPRPLLARQREPVIASHIESDQPTGKYLLANVNAGRNMDGVAPGEIKKLLIVETLPKPINFSGDMRPLSYDGTFTLERALGTVPVAADGSAYFEVPAMRSLFFVALDEKGRSVKRMQSFTTVVPGETQGCVGCHEHRAQTPQTSATHLPQALERPVSQIEPVPDVPDLMDFPRDIQPILDQHCVTCHNPDKREDGVLLTGNRGPVFSHAYYSLVAWNQVADGRNLPKSNYAPRQLGSGGSPLMEKLEPSHHGVNTSEREKQTVAMWLDLGAPYPGTYAALGTGMIGASENRSRTALDTDWPETIAAQAAFKHRCSTCHNAQSYSLPRTLSDENKWNPADGKEKEEKKEARLHRSRHIVFDLTRPDKSLFLLAPLAKAAGGYGLCHDLKKPKVEATAHGIFANTEDPDYRVLWGMIDAGRRHLSKIKRFDMPDFRPRAEYVREMKRFGALPETFDASKDPIDVYELDRKYWNLFIWKAGSQP